MNLTPFVRRRAWLIPYRSKRRLHLVIRLGEKRRCDDDRVRAWPNSLIDQLRHPRPQLLDQLSVPA